LPFGSGYGQRHACVPKVAHARAAYLHVHNLGGRVPRELKGDSPVVSIETVRTRGQQTDPAPRAQAYGQAAVVDLEASDDAQFFAPVIANVSREAGGPRNTRNTLKKPIRTVGPPTQNGINSW